MSAFRLLNLSPSHKTGDEKGGEGSPAFTPSRTRAGVPPAFESEVNSLTDIADLLEEFLLPASLTDAFDLLALLDSVNDLLTVYEQVFPEEEYRSHAKILPRACEAYSPREQEFLGLVNEGRFALPDHFLEKDLEAGMRYNAIPVLYFGLGWWNAEPEHYRIGWQLLLWLAGSFETEDARDALTDEVDEGIFDQKINAAETYNPRLTAHCSTLPGPLRHLPAALDMINYETGTVFLDQDPEMEDEPWWWTARNIEELAEQYTQAREIDNNVEELVAWIEDSPEAHMKEIIEVWNTYTETHEAMEC